MFISTAYRSEGGGAKTYWQLRSLPLGGLGQRYARGRLISSRYRFDPLGFLREGDGHEPTHAPAIGHCLSP